MTYHRNPCGICGEFDHLSSECYFADPNDYPAEPETIEVRPVYVPSAEYLAWCEQADKRREPEPYEELKRTGTGGWL